MSWKSFHVTDLNKTPLSCKPCRLLPRIKPINGRYQNFLIEWNCTKKSLVLLRFFYHCPTLGKIGRVSQCHHTLAIISVFKQCHLTDSNLGSNQIAPERKLQRRTDLLPHWQTKNHRNKQCDDDDGDDDQNTHSVYLILFTSSPYNHFNIIKYKKKKEHRTNEMIVLRTIFYLYGIPKPKRKMNVDCARRAVYGSVI